MGKKLSEMSADELRSAVCSLVKENEDLRKKAGLCSNEESVRNMMCLVCPHTECQKKDCSYYPKKEDENVSISWKEYIDFAHTLEKAEHQFVDIYRKMWKDKEHKLQITTDCHHFLYRMKSRVNDLYTLVNEIKHDYRLIADGNLERTVMLGKEEEEDDEE